MQENGKRKPDAELESMFQEGRKACEDEVAGLNLEGGSGFDKGFAAGVKQTTNRILGVIQKYEASVGAMKVKWGEDTALLEGLEKAKGPWEGWNLKRVYDGVVMQSSSVEGSDTYYPTARDALRTLLEEDEDEAEEGEQDEDEEDVAEIATAILAAKVQRKEARVLELESMLNQAMQEREEARSLVVTLAGLVDEMDKFLFHNQAYQTSTLREKVVEAVRGLPEYARKSRRPAESEVFGEPLVTGIEFGEGRREGRREEETTTIQEIWRTVGGKRVRVALLFEEYSLFLEEVERELERVKKERAALSRRVEKIRDFLSAG